MKNTWVLKRKIVDYLDVETIAIISNKPLWEIEDDSH